MKNNIIVTYIIGDKEKTIVPRVWNKNKIFSTYYMIKKYLGYIIYSINKDISFIHFKNFNFYDCKLIECAENTLCIFENCKFIQHEDQVKDLFFKGGTFELINPIFEGFQNVNTSIYRPVQSFTIIYDDENLVKENNVNLNIDNSIGNLMVMENSSGLKDLNVNIKNISLKGKINVERFHLRGNNILIGDKESNTCIEIKDSLPNVFAKQKISFINTQLECKKDLLINLEAPLIEVDNCILTAEKSLLINENIYYRKKGEDNVTISDKDLCRTQLISILKGYKNEIERQINCDAKSLLDNDTQIYKYQVDSLTKNLEDKREKFIDDLSHKSIKLLKKVN